MKTSLITKAAGLSLGLLVSVLLTSSAHAGPGAQYWQSLGKAKDATPVVAATHACPGSQVVAVTTMQPAWSNGRGPLTEVQIGTETVCHMCPVTTVATTGWANGRGPATKTEVVQPGAAHHCASGCTATAVAVN